MRNTMKAVTSIHTLDDEELSAVSGGHGRWHPHAHGHRAPIRAAAADPRGGGLDLPGGLGALGELLQLLAQVNMGAIIQLVFGDNNTVIAGLSQNNTSS